MLLTSEMMYIKNVVLFQVSEAGKPTILRPKIQDCFSRKYGYYFNDFIINQSVSIDFVLALEHKFVIHLSCVVQVSKKRVHQSQSN